MNNYHVGSVGSMGYMSRAFRGREKSRFCVVPNLPHFGSSWRLTYASKGSEGVVGLHAEIERRWRMNSPLASDAFNLSSREAGSSSC